MPNTSPMTDQKPPTSPLTQPGLQLLLAALGGMLLSWPMLHIAGKMGHWALYLYVFMVWAGLVVLLVMIGRAITRSAQPHDATPGPHGH